MYIIYVYIVAWHFFLYKFFDYVIFLYIWHPQWKSTFRDRVNWFSGISLEVILVPGLALFCIIKYLPTWQMLRHTRHRAGYIARLYPWIQKIIYPYLRAKFKIIKLFNTYFSKDCVHLQILEYFFTFSSIYLTNLRQNLKCKAYFFQIRRGKPRALGLLGGQKWQWFNHWSPNHISIQYGLIRIYTFRSKLLKIF